MKNILLISIFTLGLSSFAMAQTDTTSRASSVGQAASQSISGASQSGVDINETTSDSGNYPAHQRINENVQAPDIVSSGVDNCVAGNAVTTSFLGLAAGVSLSNGDTDCKHLRDANAVNQLGHRDWAIGILCETPDIRNAVGAQCPVAPSPAVAQGASESVVPVVQTSAPIPTLQTGPAPPAQAAFSPGMTTDQLNEIELHNARS
jgi:hypothetical protein